MESIGNYLIQMACWLTGFWLIYFLFLRKETFYETNRWFLLTGLLFSLVMPLIPITYAVTRAPLNADILLKATTVTTGSQPEEFNLFSNIWLWIYLSGTLFFAIRFSIQWIKVIHLRKAGTRLKVDSTEVILIEKETAPFSFFSKIFISKSLGNEVEMKTIVSHEKVHIQERHWADLLIFELVRILQWFNPLILFYRKAMMQNHEYLADRGATATGMNIRTYQAILANQLLGVPVVRYASSFTMFNPTKRITMMNKNKTKPMKQFKLLWAVPVMALILFAFAEPKYNYADNPSSVSQQNEKGKSISGVITDTKGEALPGAHIIVANSTTGTTSDIDGKFSLTGLKSDDELIISFIGYKTVKIKAGDNLKVQMERNVIKVQVAETGENIAPPPPPPPALPPKNNSDKGEKITTPEKVKVYGYANHKEKDDKQFVVTEEMPQFIGGGVALGSFLKKETANAKEKGVVKVFFTVKQTGEIDEIKVDDNVSKGLQEQALKVMKSMPNWIPGKQNGKNVKVNMEMNILF